MSDNNSLKKESGFTRFYNENKNIMLSGVIAFLITQLVAFCYDLVPYGDMTVLRMDLYHQYGPLFAELYDRLTSGSSLVYSWNSGLGMTFLGNFFNYLSSPLSFIVVLFGHKNITEAIAVLMMLKAILSAVSFSYYLKKSVGTNSLVISGFGVLYAFCGYFIAYYWNVMWIDAMVLFPIIILGIETIIKKGKASLYCISLAVMIFANYYMAYMICIFSFFYFFACYFANYPLTQKYDSALETKNIFKKLSNSLFVSSAFKFAVASITAALLVSVVIFPLITILPKASATGGTHPASIIKYFTAFDFFANHLSGTEATIRSSGDDVLPNVYCGIFTLILCVLYLYSKKISIKEKVTNILLLALLYFSFNINYLNFVWHGFHFPNDLPYRFSFMYSFLLLTMAFRAFQNIDEFKSHDFLSVGIGLIFFVILVEKITSKNVDDKVVLISVAFSVAYVVVLWLFKKLKPETLAVCVLLVALLSSEVAVATTPNYSMNQSKTNYTSDYDSFKNIKSQLDERESNAFYRMELTDLRTRMDPSWYDYNGVSVFSSMAYEKVSNVQQKLGLYGNYINSYTYKKQTPVYNTMFGLKYLVDKNGEDMTNAYYTQLYTNDNFTAYENNYPLPVAYAANPEVLLYDAYAYSNPFTAQSELFRMTSGVDGVFERLEIDNATYSNINDFYTNEYENGEFRYSKVTDNQAGSVCFEITPAETGNVYVYFNCKNAASVIVNSLMTSTSLQSLDEPYVYDLGVANGGETLFVDIEIKSDSNYGNLDFSAYTVNESKFSEGYEKLKAGEFKIDKYNDTTLSGTITAQKDNIVFTTIPFDKSWDVYIDGHRLPSGSLNCVSESFLAFPISEGEHTLTLAYRSNGLIVGAFISIVTIIICTVFIILKRRFNKADKWKKLNAPDPLDITVEEPQRTSFSERIDEYLGDYDESELLETFELNAEDITEENETTEE